MSNHYHNPPEVCDLCISPIKETFYDCAVIYMGRTTWANVCHNCFANYGIGLGAGRGQQWAKGKNGGFYKVQQWVRGKSGRFYKVGDCSQDFAER